MVRSMLALFAAAIVAAPATAATLMDFVPPVQDREPVPVSNPGGPRGHVVIEDLENTLRSGMQYDHMRGGLDDGAQPSVGETVTALPPVATAAVPEPLTWAMMLAGFAVVGGALRRRTSRTTASLSH